MANADLEFGVTSILNTKQFSWVFLVECIMVVLLSLFVLFYFNQWIGWMLSKVASWYLWKHYQVEFVVGSIQLSIFGGQLYLKNVKYISKSYAVSVVYATLHWRFWLRRSRVAALFAEDQEQNKKNQCPLHLEVHGLECFIYNRSVAYDNIDDMVNGIVKPNRTISKELGYVEENLMRLLPLEIDINRFSTVVGNRDTESLLVLYSKSIAMVVDVDKATNELDRYLIVLESSWKRPKMTLYPNLDYQMSKNNVFPSRKGPWYRLGKIRKQKKSEPGAWRGLNRYHLAEDSDQAVDQTPNEYARVPNLFEAEEMSFEYLADVAGPTVLMEKPIPPPMCQANLTVTTGVINYGPWSERQRIQLMQAFYPQVCVDSVPTPEVGEEGTVRLTPKIKTIVDFVNQVNVHVAVREFSKDMQWMNHLISSQAANVTRPYGWVDYIAEDGSNGIIEVDLYASDYGFRNKVHLFLDKLEMRTSVNHDLALKTSCHSVTITQNAPLQWNGLQDWKIEHVTENLDFFFLREQASLVTDYFRDQSDQQPVDYEFFVPALYSITWKVTDFNLRLNVNSQNIINNPTSTFENTFLVFKTKKVQFDINVMADQVRPLTNTSKIQLFTEQLDLEVSAPPWHMLHSFLESDHIGRVHDFKVAVDFTYNCTEDSKRPETEKIEVSGRDFTLVAFGFAINYLMTIRENYFGQNYHFQTSEEYHQKMEQGEEVSEEFEFSRFDADLDVQMHFDVTNCCLVLPGYLYSSKSCIALHFASLAADMRFTNYYMDLQAEFTPCTGFLHDSLPSESAEDLAQLDPSELGAPPVIFITEVIISAHRMFGLPPVEPTYVCCWNIELGDVLVDGPVDIVESLACIGQFSKHSFLSVENKPVIVEPELFDVTFLCVDLQSFSLVLHAENDSRLELKTSTISMRKNDFANERYTGRMTCMIPNIELRGYSDNALVVLLQTSVAWSAFTKVADPARHYQMQQDHIALHDMLFHRCPFLLDDWHRENPPYNTPPADHIAPAIPLPPLPPQLTQQVVMSTNPQTIALDFERDMSSKFSASSRSQYSGSNSSLFSSAESSASSDDSESSARARANVGPLNYSFGHQERFYGFLPPEEFGDTGISNPDHDFKLDSHEWHPGAPSLPNDDAEREYDDVVLEFGTITGTILPQTVQLVDSISVSLCAFDAQAAFDRMHCIVVDTLTEDRTRKYCQRVLVKLDSANVRFGLAKTKAGAGVQMDVPEDNIHLEPNHVLLSLEGLNLILQHGDAEVPVVADVHLGLLGLSINGPEERLTSTAVSLRISQIKGFVVVNDDSVGSINAKHVDFFWSERQTKWVTNYVLKLVYEFHRLKKLTVAKVSRRDEMAYAMLEVARASEQHNIEQDSYVLSRPFGGVQTSDHVRSHISWRISVRLRHLLNFLPPEEIEEMEATLSGRDYTVPEDAKKQMVDIFSRWRSWEQTEDLQSALIFTRMFEVQPSRWDTANIAMRILIDGIASRLNYEDHTEDYIVLDYFTIYGALRPTAATIFTSVMLTCARSRSHLSSRVLGPFASVMHAAAIFEHPELWTEMFSQNKTPKSKRGTQKKARVVRGFVLAFVQDFGFEVGLKSFNAELQCSQVQALNTFIASSTNWYHCTMAAMANSCLSVVRPNGGDLFDYIMEGVSLGIMGWETYTRVACNVGALSLASNARLVEFCPVITEFFSTDLETLKEFASVVNTSTSRMGFDQDSEKHSASTRSDSTQADEDEETEPIPVHFNVEVKKLTIKLALVENLRTVLSGHSLVARTRHPDETTMLVDLHIDRGVLSVLYGDGVPVASVELQDVSNLLRSEPGSQVLEALLSIKSAKLDTMELLWFLDLVKEKNFFCEIDTMSEILSSITTQYSDALETLPSQVSLVDPEPSEPSLVNYQVQIGQAQLSLPLHDSTFTVIVRYISGRYFNFKRDERDHPRPCPTEVSGSLDECRIELDNKREPHTPKTPKTPLAPSVPTLRSPVLAFQLAATYNAEGSSQRVQISSSYCKIVLNPVRAVSISQAVTKLQSRSNFFETLDRSSTDLAPRSSQSDFLATIEKIDAVFSLRDQSFTWQTRVGAGIVVGHDLLNVRKSELTARMELHGFYVQPDSANMDKVTRAQLPRIALTAVVLPDEDGHFLYLHNTGESLIIDVSAAAVPLLVGLADSMDETRHLYSAGLPPAHEKKENEPESPTARSPFRLPFSCYGTSSISKARFRLFEEYGSDQSPSLELHSPAANIIFDYRRKSLPVRDTMNVHVDISESSNTVFPRALQELRNMAKMIQFQLRNRHRNEEATSLAPPPGSTGPPSQPPTPTKPKKLRIRTSNLDPTDEPTSSVEDFKQLLSNIEFALSLKLSAQQLTLSCEPFTKVATKLVYDSITILLTSPKDDASQEYLALSGTVKGARISLQHMFSHERSADAGIGLFTFTAIYRHRSTHPIELGVLTADPQFNLRVSKLNDIQSFIDIWTPVSTSETDLISPTVATPLLNDATPLQTYRKAMASVAFRFSVIWHIRNVKGHIDLGQSIGKAEVEIDRLWLSSLKKSQKSQFFAAGLGNLNVSCEGRVGGALEIKGTSAHLSVEFSDEIDQTPQILFASGLPSLDLYLSLDFNPFLALCIGRSSLAIGNTQKPTLDYDDLDISYQCESAMLTFTALAASHLYDMAELIGTFKMPPTTPALDEDDPVAIKQYEVNQRNLNLLTRLKVKLHLSVGHTVLYIFPTDLSESTAMALTSGGTKVRFVQWIDQTGLHSDFEFRTQSLLLSLAAMQSSFSVGDVTSLQVDSFFEAASKFSKTNIITIPECTVEMYALLKPNGRRLFYKFGSDFMGTVEVGWNLGSVAFIREIATAHSKAWDFRKKIFMASQDPVEITEDDFPAPPKPKSWGASTQGPRQSTPLGRDDDRSSFMSVEDFDMARRLLEALLNSDLRFAEIPKYHFIEPPRINIPQLHDMGEATPPVEWIGLDRHKLPEAVHWYLIRGLNGIILEVEQVYGNVIERM